MNEITVSGAPSSSSVDLNVAGEGFVTPALNGATCKFTYLGPTADAVIPEWERTSYTSSLVASTTTSVTCKTPTGRTGAWKVQVLQNGIHPEPTLYGDPIFSTYDLASLRVTSLDPPGGVVGVSTTVTVIGSGFAEYGVGQLKCRVGGASGTLINGELLDSDRMLCTLPAATSAGSTDVTVSLNNGAAGTFSADEVSFIHYTPPHIVSTKPTEGKAEGGTPGLAAIGDGGIDGGGGGDPDDDGSLLHRVVSGQARAADVQYAVLDAWSRVRRMGDRAADRAVELGPL